MAWQDKILIGHENNKSIFMKNIINFTQASDLILSKVRVIALQKGVDVSNKEKLVNYSLELLNEKL